MFKNLEKKEKEWTTALIVAIYYTILIYVALNYWPIMESLIEIAASLILLLLFGTILYIPALNSNCDRKIITIYYCILGIIICIILVCWMFVGSMALLWLILNGAHFIVKFILLVVLILLPFLIAIHPLMES